MSMKPKLCLLLMLLLYAGMSYAKSDTTMYYNIAVGDTFQVKLTECGSCGYSWQWVNKSRVDNVDSIRTSYVGVAHPEGYVGYSQIFGITFEGIKAGTDTVKLVYGRSWEHSVQKDTAFIIVKVSDKIKLNAEGVGIYPNPVKNSLPGDIVLLPELIMYMKYTI